MKPRPSRDDRPRSGPPRGKPPRGARPPRPIKPFAPRQATSNPMSGKPSTPGVGGKPFGGRTVPPRSIGPRQTTHWGDVAEWYDELVGDEGSEFHRFVVHPGLLRLLDPQPGQRVLDVACGQGVLCRLLRERGMEVVGVDAAEPLLQAARQRSDPSITYLHGDARALTDLREIKPCTFDAATNVLAIQNIDAVQPVFEGVARALRPGGRFVLVMMHPAFRVPKASDWGWDARGGVQYRRVDRYLSRAREMIVSHPGRRDGRHTWTFHQPLQTYINALGEAGLWVNAMEEWPSHRRSQRGPRSDAENKARKEIPLFMALRAMRCG